MDRILPNTSKSTKYIKAIVVKLDPFESKILFEKNYDCNQTNKVHKDLSKYDYGNNICHAYEMDIEL